jgi:TolA-binding protein
MKVKRAARRGSVACLGIAVWIAAALAGALRAQDQPALAGKLKAAGAPVRAVALEGGSLVVSLEYAKNAVMEPQSIRRHALSVFRAVPGMLPAGAVRVAVEIGGPGEVYDSWSASARDAADFSGGRLDEARFMARLEMKSPVPLKDLIGSAVPDEKELERQLQKLEAESQKPGGQKPAPAAKPAPDKPAPAKADAAKPTAAMPAQPAPVRPQAGTGAAAPPPTTTPAPKDVLSSPKALFEQGERLLKERDYWGATDYFRKTLDAFPMESHQGLGLCYYGGGLIDAALKHFTEAYRLEPRSKLTVLYLGTCNDKLGRRDEAVRRYEEYLALGPDDPKVAEFVRGRLAALR